MKILVFVHTAWIEMMRHAWQLAGASTIALPLPVGILARDPRLRRESAESIVQAVRDTSPDWILDVNGVGVLPLDDAGTAWTSDCTDTPWCVWWWDAPHSCAYPLRSPDQAGGWIAALKQPHIRHFMWDRVLAGEFETWFGKTVAWLPTATHSGLFHPDAPTQTTRTFAPVDISFLGTFYNEAELIDSDELELLKQERIARPEQTYFDIADTNSLRLPQFIEQLARARQDPLGTLYAGFKRWKYLVDLAVGVARRNRPLDLLREVCASRRFMGTGWPERFHADSHCLYQPLDLVTCYQNSCLNLDLGNAQSFTGTTMRSYEIMSSKAVLVCRRYPDFDPSGELENQVYLSYAQPEELPARVKTWLADESALRNIARNARQFIEEKNAWTHRLMTLCRHLETR